MKEKKSIKKTGYSILDGLQAQPGHVTYPITAVKTLHNPSRMIEFADAYLAFTLRSVEATPASIRAGILDRAREEGPETFQRWQKAFDNDMLIRLNQDTPITVSILAKAMAKLKTPEEVKRFFNQYSAWTAEHGDTPAIRSDPEADVRAQIIKLQPVYDEATRAMWNTAVVDLYYSPKERAGALSEASRE